MRYSSLFLAFSLVIATRAHATSSMASALQSDLGLAKRPACTTCHETPNGGSGTATQPFVLSLFKRGFVLGDTASLKTAIAALEGEKTDSDGDGTGDIAELRAGGDPNAGVGGEVPEVPEYGCSLQAPSNGCGESWLVAATLLALLSSRRRSPNTIAKSS